jgi:effector-binding domain-containing protein
MSHAVEIVTVPPATAAVLRFHVSFEEMPTIGHRMRNAFATVDAHLTDADISHVGPPLAFYQMEGDGFAVMAGYRVPAHSTPPATLECLDVGEVRAAHTVHLGPYRDLQGAYSDLLAQIRRGGEEPEMNKPMWEEYYSDPGTPEALIRTEVYWPIVRADISHGADRAGTTRS